MTACVFCCYIYQNEETDVMEVLEIKTFLAGQP